MTFFDGKLAVVIGATSIGGLGEAVARDLSRQGATVVVAGRRLEAAEALAKSIHGHALRCDIADEASIEALMRVAASTHGAGHIDIVVNAAGLPVASSFAELDAVSLRQSADCNLIGPALAMKHAARYLKRGGVFLQFTSISAQQPTPFTTPYAIFKAGLEHALRLAALEFGAAGLRFLGIAPGIVFTPMTAFIENEITRAAVTGVTPLGRMVSADDVAAMARFLVSGDCYETGHVFPVTGGAALTRALLPQEFFPPEAG